MESTLYIEAMDCEEEAKLIRASLHHLNGLEKYEIEAAGRIRGMAFDKTGYLTLGRPVVTDIVPFGAKTEDEVLSLASSIESRSEHVLAEAILMRAREEGVAVRDVGGGLKPFRCQCCKAWDPYKRRCHIEAASRIRAMAFDKTGSLTLGRPVVTDIVPFGAKTEDEVLSLASSIESRSEHVLAEAILMRAGEERVAVQDVGGGEAVPGLGARAVIGGRPYGLGSSALCSADSISSDARERIEKLEGEGKTLILLTEEDDLIGAIAVRDEIRPEARDTVVSLKASV